jgi:hypothetical protein
MDEPAQDLDAVNRELAEVVDALNATPTDDFAARHALRTRQDELRELAAAFRVDADEQRSTEDLRRELAAREAQVTAIYGAAMEQVSQSGGGGGDFGSPVAAAEGSLTAKGRDATGAPEIRARIARLREILAAREEK